MGTYESDGDPLSVAAINAIAELVRDKELTCHHGVHKGKRVKVVEVGYRGLIPGQPNAMVLDAHPVDDPEDIRNGYDLHDFTYDDGTFL